MALRQNAGFGIRFCCPRISPTPWSPSDHGGSGHCCTQLTPRNDCRTPPPASHPGMDERLLQTSILIEQEVELRSSCPFRMSNSTNTNSPLLHSGHSLSQLLRSTHSDKRGGKSSGHNVLRRQIGGFVAHRLPHGVGGSVEGSKLSS